MPPFFYSFFFNKCLSKNELSVDTEIKICDCKSCNRLMLFIKSQPKDVKYRILRIAPDISEMKLKNGELENCPVCLNKENLYICPWGCSQFSCEKCYTLGCSHLNKNCIEKCNTRYKFTNLKDNARLIFGMTQVSTHNKQVMTIDDWFYQY